jgi:hypothetical protein
MKDLMPKAREILFTEKMAIRRAKNVVYDIKYHSIIPKWPIT